MKRIMKSAFVLLTVCFGIVGNLSAHGLSSSFDACLPPTSDGNMNAEDCPLKDHPPIPIGQSIDVSDCRFLPEKAEAPGHVFLTMQCTVYNGSKRRVAFFQYGVVYVKAGSNKVLAEVGFEGEQRFSTALLVPVLQPQETRPLRLVTSDLPTEVIGSQMDIFVEVLGVGMPNGRILR
ncbi:hypothetical protein [uncultured Roseobacter sp.]|uniref:hypothetical protein n=1 Tax=uncultured Roseobacter sp. TaxID=114847 RepID=UPI00261C012E|nr:hypothetical protein [uncultured Roseobacter sp.]